MDMDNRQICVVNPATGEQFASIPGNTQEEVESILREARTVFGSWAATPAIERSGLLLSFAQRLRASTDEIASLLVSEGGKCIVEAEWEIQWVSDAFEYYAGIARHRGGMIAPTNSPETTNLVVKHPVGVVAAILPWNFPLLLWAWKAAPALAAGNCVVAKSSPETPLSLQRTQELLGLPNGVHQVVYGFGEVGGQLVSAQEVDMVAFTGTSATGTAILETCARQSKRVIAEMSGNDPFIITRVSDLEAAAEALVFAAFVNAGQVCTSAERIYVDDAIYDEFVEILVARVSKMRVGDPSDPRVEMGPMITEAQCARVMHYISDACSAGANLLAGGRRMDHVGFFVEPTILGNVSHEFLKKAGELFGPVAPLVRVNSFDEALQLANDSPYGLGANVLTDNLDYALRAGRELECGTVWVNSPLMDNNAAPFGGWKASGIGRELGEEGYDAFTETKHVSLDSKLVMQPWWLNER